MGKLSTCSAPDLLGRCQPYENGANTKKLPAMKSASAYGGHLVMRRASATVCLIVGALIGCADGVYAAQPDIGSAALAKNDVSREISGANGPVDVGDPVFTDEIVRTGVNSVTKLVFRNSTNLALGPKSKVVLDRFVYDPSRPSEALGVTVAKGLFRFTTGSLQKSAYTVTTPTAVIGVRGTVYNGLATRRYTRVTVEEGNVLLCPRKKGISFEEQARKCEEGHSSHCDCAVLTPGQTGQVSNGASHAVLVSTPVQFANLSPARCVRLRITPVCPTLACPTLVCPTLVLPARARRQRLLSLRSLLLLRLFSGSSGCLARAAF